ncbi:hypothetical protein MXD63_20370 [Frankia sp. Cpl3]|nr:hypothetical protein [Frankia sp. Cpl3]
MAALLGQRERTSVAAAVAGRRRVAARRRSTCMVGGSTAAGGVNGSDGTPRGVPSGRGALRLCAGGRAEGAGAGGADGPGWPVSLPVPGAAAGL